MLAAVRTVAETVDTHVDELGRLDAIAGDGDHGIGMQRGSHAALAAATTAVDAGAGARTTLARAADAWADKAGGTSGALWGVILNAIAGKLGDEGRPDAAAVAAGVAAGSRGVTDYGKAEVGDKTLVDALVPFTSTLTQAVDAGASAHRRVADGGGCRDPGRRTRPPTCSPAWAAPARTARTAWAPPTRARSRSRSS